MYRDSNTLPAVAATERKTGRDTPKEGFLRAFCLHPAFVLPSSWLHPASVLLRGMAKNAGKGPKNNANPDHAQFAKKSEPQSRVTKGLQCRIPCTQAADAKMEELRKSPSLAR